MRVIVCGGRGYHDRKTVYATLDAVHADRDFTELIHGCATGADTLAGEWADERNVPRRKFYADWKQFDRAAGPKRNRDMLNTGPDLVVAFPGGAGTANMTGIAIEAGVEVLEV